MSMVPTVILNDGHTIPQFGLGVFLTAPDEVADAVRHALSVGYRHIDTAALYRNEAGVGEAIRASGVPREDVFVTTKLWNDRHRDAPAALAESLEKLGMDHVDLYLIHWPTPWTDTYLTAWESLIALRDQGLTRSIGVSNFHEAQLRRIIAETGVTPAVNQIELHPTLAQVDLVALNEALDIRTQSWSPLGRRADLDLPTITGIATAHGRTPAQVILRWHLQRGLIVFPKSITPARIEENVAIFDFTLDDAEMAAITALDTGNRIGPDPERKPT